MADEGHILLAQGCFLTASSQDRDMAMSPLFPVGHHDMGLGHQVVPSMSPLVLGCVNEMTQSERAIRTGPKALPVPRPLTQLGSLPCRTGAWHVAGWSLQCRKELPDVGREGLLEVGLAQGEHLGCGSLAAGMCPSIAQPMATTPCGSPDPASNTPVPPSRPSHLLMATHGGLGVTHPN